MQFSFTPLVSFTANSFLERSAAHLATLTPKARDTWFRLWIPAMRNAPVGADVGAMDHALVVATLERWQHQTTAVAA